MPATEALKLGILDEIVEENPFEAAIKLARRILGKNIQLYWTKCNTTNSQKKIPTSGKNYLADVTIGWRKVFKLKIVVYWHRIWGSSREKVK